MRVDAASVGAAVLQATSTEFVGRVEGVFGGGFYVSGPSETILAVLGPHAWAGPLHLVVRHLPALPAAHDRVTVSGRVLQAGPCCVRIEDSLRWEPRLPAGLGSLAWIGVGGFVAPELRPVWGAVIAAVERGDLGSVFDHLQGRGSGLTPSGDDVLAGILLACSIDPRQRGALDDLARSARTTRLSRAFLRWAAAGHSIEPAHALLDAAASDDLDGTRRAERSLATVGATSGRALAAGLALAATKLPPRMVPRLAVA